jgi:thymidylate kinase
MRSLPLGDIDETIRLSMAGLSAQSVFIIYLDISADKNVDRLLSRQHPTFMLDAFSKGSVTDTFDDASFEGATDLIVRYRKTMDMLKTRGYTVETIDANLNPDEVFNNAVSHINKVIDMTKRK